MHTLEDDVPSFWFNSYAQLVLHPRLHSLIIFVSVYRCLNNAVSQT